MTPNNTIHTMKTRKTKYSIKPETIEKIKSLGFQVYMKDLNDSWLYYGKEDGLGGLGYLQSSQWSRGADFFRISTVHKPSKQVGTGFSIMDDGDEKHVENMTEEDLKSGLVFAPSWVSYRDLSSVKKYASFEEFRNGSYFNKDYKEV